MPDHDGPADEYPRHVSGDHPSDNGMGWRPPPPNHGNGNGNGDRGAPVSDWRLPLTVRETIIICGAALTIGVGWSSIFNAQVRLENRLAEITARQDAHMNEIQATISQALTDFRLHIMAPGHSVELERLDHVSDRLGSVEATMREVLRLSIATATATVDEAPPAPEILPTVKVRKRRR